MNAPTTTAAVQTSPWTVPFPVLLNVYKHHAGALRQIIADSARDGEAALASLAKQLTVIGTELMDLYIGPLTPAEVGARVLAILEAEGRLGWEAYQPWIEESNGYRVLTFPQDGSRWVLRLGEVGGRHVHVHPARWAPDTRRVRANVLKTAVLVLAVTAAQGGDPTDVFLVNRVRQQYLCLAPMRELSTEQGLGVLLDVLRASAEHRRAGAGP